MHKLLSEGKTDLLTFVSARTKRGFSAYLVRQPDGKIGFEFEAKDPSKSRGPRTARAPTALRVLGRHPADQQPVELHAGRYGPYIKHGSVNATLSDTSSAETVTLDEAVTLLAAKAASAGGSERTAVATRQRASARTARPSAKLPTSRATPVATPPSTRRSSATPAAKTKTTRSSVTKPAAGAKKTPAKTTRKSR
jgi:hypothetical protein